MYEPHRILDRIVHPLNDDFWTTYYPPDDISTAGYKQKCRRGNRQDCLRNKNIHSHDTKYSGDDEKSI